MRIRTLSGLLACLLTIGLLACALHLALDAAMRRLRTGQFGAFNRAADGRVNADIIITGSSRATMGYDPAVLTSATGLSAFNLGRIGALINIHTGILRFYLHHNRAPRLLIENVDPFSLNVDEKLYDVPQFTPYLYDPALYQAVHKRYNPIWKARYLPLYGYVVNDTQNWHYVGLSALFGIQPVEDYENGYSPIDREWVDIHMPHRFIAEARGVEDFNEFLSEAQTRGIPTILVFSPVYEENLARLEKLPELKAAFAEIAQRHGAVFWDLSDLAPISSNKRYFFDYLHLNMSGATAFSQVLGQRLAAWLADQHQPAVSLRK